MGIEISIPVGGGSSNATNSSTTYTNATFYNNSTCHLSPKAQYQSTVLLAFVSSIVTGLGSGPFIPFYTAWICWFALLRILMTAFWEVFEAICFRPLEGGDQFYEFWNHFPGLGRIMEDCQIFDDPFFREGAEPDPPSFLGWVSWIWTALYAPVSQTIWLVLHWNNSTGSLKLVRALGVSVTALPLTMDTRARYGAGLARYLGRWSQILFTLIHAISCMLLGVVATIELVRGAVEIGIKPWVYVIYIIFLCFWTHLAFSFSTPHDEAYGARRGGMIVAGMAMGAFGAIFTATPGFVMMLRSPSSPGVSVMEYLKCEKVSLWQKFSAASP